MKRLIKRFIAVLLVSSISLNITACFLTKKIDNIPKTEVNLSESENVDVEVVQISEDEEKELSTQLQKYYELEKDTHFYQKREDENTLELFDVSPEFRLEISSDDLEEFDLYENGKNIKTSYKVEEDGDYLLTNKWKEGSTYRIELYEGQTFSDENYAEFDNLVFSIKRPKTNKVKYNKNVKVYNSQEKTKINSLDDIPKNDRKEGEIILIQNKDTFEYEAYKITKVNKDSTIETEQPDLEEIYNDLNFYDTFSISISDDYYKQYLMEHKDDIISQFRESWIMEMISENLCQQVYAADNNSGITSSVIKYNLPISLSLYEENGFNGFRFLLDFFNLGFSPLNSNKVEGGIQSNLNFLTGHRVYLEIDIAFKADVLADIKSIRDFKFVVDDTMRLKFSFKISVTGNDPFTTLAENLNFKKLLTLPESSMYLTDFDAGLFNLPIPTPILGVSINFTVSFIPKLVYLATIEIGNSITVNVKAGLSCVEGKFDPIGNINIDGKLTKFNFLGQATMFYGFGFEFSLRFISEKLSKVGIQPEVGVYAEAKGIIKCENNNGISLKDFEKATVSFEVGKYVKLKIKANILTWKYDKIILNQKFPDAKVSHDFKFREDGGISIDTQVREAAIDPLAGSEWDPNAYTNNYIPSLNKNGQLSSQFLNGDFSSWTDLGQGKYRLTSEFLTNMTCFVKDGGSMDGVYTFDENGVALRYGKTTFVKLLPIVSGGTWQQIGNNWFYFN